MEPQDTDEARAKASSSKPRFLLCQPDQNANRSARKEDKAIHSTGSGEHSRELQKANCLTGASGTK